MGLMIFSRLLSWLLDHYKHAVIATMCGFLMGSLSVLWPWKQVALKSGGGFQNITPQNYLEITGQDPQIIACMLVFLFGLFMVLVIEIISLKLKNKVI
ncbi:MAG: Uncharacterised protein [Cellvibrionales bacterium UBA7375]|nr:MAG: Uncharacterised protein [Cellvibrionales bacterium UBA7375]